LVDSKTIGLRGIAVDITESKRMTEELLKIQKLDSISLLAGGIAHDFNNILTSILGSVSLVKELKDPQVIENMLVNAENACEKAKGLTQQLLTFSKGGLPVKELTYLSKILKDAVLFASSGANTRCAFSIPDDLWWAEIDEVQINQVISNIVINANQAMPNGGVIEISAENVVLEYLKHNLPLVEGNYIKVSITDHGIGIPNDIIPKIFDPFFTTKSKGNGLGLATCYSIINKHGGYINVDSQIGIGTTFSFYLQASLNKGLVKDTQEQHRFSSSNGRILVMDDDENIRQICFHMLSQLGYDVVTTSDGTEAIEMYKKAKDGNQPFDIVIMDLVVQDGMGGKEAIRRLREFDPKVKAIVSSGYSNDEVMSQFHKFGFKDAISKPYRMREISKILEKVL
jgi:two-component system cell cycle sensor histidine kinase/response regulator CckA